MSRNAAGMLRILDLKFSTSIVKQRLNFVVYQRLLRWGQSYYARIDPELLTCDYINTCLEVEHPIVSAKNLKQMGLTVNKIGKLEFIQGRT